MTSAKARVAQIGLVNGPRPPARPTAAIAASQMRQGGSWPVRERPPGQHQGNPPRYSDAAQRHGSSPGKHHRITPVGVPAELDAQDVGPGQLHEPERLDAERIEVVWLGADGTRRLQDELEGRHELGRGDRRRQPSPKGQPERGDPEARPPYSSSPGCEELEAGRFPGRRHGRRSPGHHGSPGGGDRRYVTEAASSPSQGRGDPDRGRPSPGRRPRRPPPAARRSPIRTRAHGRGGDRSPGHRRRPPSPAAQPTGVPAQDLHGQDDRQLDEPSATAQANPAIGRVEPQRQPGRPDQVDHVGILEYDRDAEGIARGRPAPSRPSSSARIA